MPPHTLFDQASSIKAAGLSLNMICQQYSDQRLRTILARGATVRMFGSAAVDLAWVAEGRIGASVMLANKPWDTVAGVLLAREAGAEVIDREGRPHSLGSDSTVAVAPALRDDLVRILAE